MWSKTIRVVVFILGVSLPLFGQYYYEKNKIQREVTPTYTYETEHFSIYIEEGGEPLARFAGGILEESYKQRTADFGVTVGVKIPVIIYKSQPDFAATNIILEPIEESVGGFSELFKNRVVVPFTGSYSDLKHVLEHELVHIFEFELYYSLTLSNLFSLIPGFTPPLWIMEGAAEFCSSHGSGEEDAFMQDLLLNNNIIPLEELGYWSGYLVYRQGESVFLFIEDRYGRKKVFELLNELQIRRDMNAAFDKVFGMNVKDFGKEWLNWLRMRYWPGVARLDNRSTQARLLTDHEKDFSYYNGSVALSPTGAKIAYATSKDDYIAINVISGFDGKPLKRLLRAGQSATFERLPLLRNTMCWSGDESALAVIGFSKERPVLLWVDYASAKVTRRYQLKVDDAYSPVVSSDGSQAVFVGVNEGASDLYSLDLKTGKINRLTFDLYEEKDPSFSGDTIYFASDRPDQDSTWNVGSYAVWSLLPSGRVKRVTERYGFLSSPHVVNDNLYFVGAGYQLYRMTPSDSVPQRMTDWFDKIEEFSPASSGKTSFLLYNNSGWDVCMLNGTLGSLEPVPENKDTVLAVETAPYSYKYVELTPEELKPYKPTFSADYIYGTGAYSSLYGAQGSFSLGVSDMLGDHRIYVDAELYGDILYSDIVLTYWNFKRRVDWATGAYQLADFYRYWLTDSTFDYIKEARRGASALLSFPFTKFFRFETGVDGMAVTAHEYLNCYYDSQGQLYYTSDTSYTYPLFQGSGALVFDNALWKYSTPMRGLRLRLEGYSSIPAISRLSYQSVIADMRGYVSVTKRSALALRLLGAASFGTDHEWFTLGGPYDVRGYNPYVPSIGSKIVFSNLELRVPFVDLLNLAFPIPMRLSDLRGVVFTDAGFAWDEDAPVLWDSTGQLVDLKAGFGFGLRYLFGYWMLKLDFARPYIKSDPDLYGWDVWRAHFRIGADF